MRLHMILNMPAVLSIHKDWKAGERAGEREGERGEEECGGGNPQEGRHIPGPILAAYVLANCQLGDSATPHIAIIRARVRKGCHQGNLHMLREISKSQFITTATGLGAPVSDKKQEA